MKKSILAILLALVMVASLLPFGALADGTSLPAEVNGVIKLTENVTLSADKVFTRESVTIDLAGYTLSLPMIAAKEGAAVTITDSSEDKNGKIVSGGSNTAAVYENSAIILNAGEISNTAKGGNAVFNMGTLTINGGKITGETAVYNSAWNGPNEVTGKIVCNMTGGVVQAGTWGICLMGHGVKDGDLSTVVNDALVFNFSGGKIYAAQGICGNASSGTRAGFTVNMTGGDIICENETGMYLPSIGVTNMSGGTITAAQGIRICSGELNVTGGTIICTDVSDDSDLIAGGSGGTIGAVVVGKAGTGYVGDIKVNIGGSAVIKNTATGATDAIYPTIVVSDKNMAQATPQNYKNPATGNNINATFAYSETSTVVNVSAQVIGDVVKISNLEDTITQDGGNTSLCLNGAKVTGNVLNQSKEGGVEVHSSIVGGTVSASDSNSVTVIKSDVGSTSGNNVAVMESFVSGKYVESSVGSAVASVNGKTYDDIHDAMAAAKSGNTVKLLDDVVISSDINVPAGVTIDGNSKTIKVDTTGYTGYVLNFAADDCTNVKLYNLTLDGNGNACTLLKVSSGTNCSGLYAENVAFKNAKWGVYLSDDSGNHPNANNIQFVNCDFEDLTYAGIYAQRGNIAVTDGYFNNIKPNDNGTAAGILIDTAYFDEHSYSLSVTDSVFTNIVGTTSSEKATGAVSFTGSGTVSEFTMTDNSFYGNTIDLRIGKDTAPTFTATNIDNNGNINVVAAPGAKIFTATFYSDNSLYETIVTDGTVTMPAIRKSGYAFLGWVSGGKTYLAGETVTITANTTFTASWVRHADVPYVPEPEQPEQPETPTFPFYDVSSSAWYYSAVKYVYENKLMDGVDTYVFAPNDTLTRAMVWTIIARMSGVDTTGGNTWYAKAQEWVVVNGISDGENPTAAITREQLVTMLYRYAQIKGYDVSVGENTNILSYVDATSISEYAMSAFQWACGSGLTEGDENGALTPLATATRAQAAAMIMRFCESVK